MEFVNRTISVTKLSDRAFFLQPFPRQEFGESHMESTLRELQLIPTGSLVLKKIETPQVVDVGQ